MARARDILIAHPANRARQAGGSRPANAIWPWGGGRRAQLPSFESLRGLRGGVISAVALVKSIGLLAGMDVMEVEGATGYLDSNLAGKTQAALDYLASGGEFVCVHVEAPDEAGHHGRFEEKREAIERFDRDVVAGLLRGSAGWDCRFLVVSDHRTPIAVGDHTRDWVPWILASNPVGTARRKFSEALCEGSELVPSGPALLERLLKRG